MNELIIEDDAHVRVLQLDRPARRNALTVALVKQLAAAVTSARDDGIRAIVLTGTQPAFCAGGDLDDLSGVADDGALAVTETIYRNFHHLVRTLAEAPPVIAAINGPALGAGLDLAVACDLRLASRDATFASSWINVGLVPGMGGGWMLPRTMTSARAAQLLLTGRKIEAQQALEWGLVTDVLAAEELIHGALELAGHIASLPPIAVERTKASLRRGLEAGFAEELAAMGGVQGTLLTGPDFQAAAARFRR